MVWKPNANNNTKNNNINSNDKRRSTVFRFKLPISNSQKKNTLDNMDRNNNLKKSRIESEIPYLTK